MRAVVVMPSFQGDPARRCGWGPAGPGLQGGVGPGCPPAGPSRAGFRARRGGSVAGRIGAGRAGWSLARRRSRSLAGLLAIRVRRAAAVRSAVALVCRRCAGLGPATRSPVLSGIVQGARREPGRPTNPTRPAPTRHHRPDPRRLTHDELPDSTTKAAAESTPPIDPARSAASTSFARTQRCSAPSTAASPRTAPRAPPASPRSRPHRSPDRAARSRCPTGIPRRTRSARPRSE